MTMNIVLTVCRLILLFFKLIMWIVFLPFIIAVTYIRMAISRLKFKSQLIKSGVPEEWAKKLSKRYTLRFEDVRYMMRMAKKNKVEIKI